jgi:dTDP-4-amino-4,6-dideoxygalactose transaminase
LTGGSLRSRGCVRHLSYDATVMVEWCAMKIPFNDLKAQYLSIKTDVDAAIASVIERTAFISGPDIEEFETMFTDYCGGGCYAAGVANGTDGLQLALRALDIGPGDEVITTAHSFVATAESIFNVGAKPVFVDIRPDTCNMDEDKIEAAITPRTKAIMPVHLYGQACNMGPIRDIAEQHGLKIVEDAAQSQGASCDGVRTGLLGDIAAFSLYPGKNLGAYGDAGIVVSKDEELISVVRQLRDHGRGKSQKFNHGMVGVNSRLDTIQAAILKVKLPHLDGWNARRRKIGEYYNGRLSNIVETPVALPGMEHIYHVYCIRTDDRDKLAADLKERGVATGMHYPSPQHLHTGVIDKLGHKPGDFPEAERTCDRLLSLPIYAEMNDNQVEYVVESVATCLAG